MIGDPTQETLSDDSEQALFEYGHGGVPFLLLLLYLSFLTFFTWYVLEFQLPDFLQQGPGQDPQSTEAAFEPGTDPEAPEGDG